MRGLVFKDWEMFDEAERDLRRAIEIAPNADASARTNLGLVKIQQCFQLLGVASTDPDALVRLVWVVGMHGIRAGGNCNCPVAVKTVSYLPIYCILDVMVGERQVRKFNS